MVVVVVVVVVVVDNRGRDEVWSRGGVEGLVHGVVAPIFLWEA